MYVYNMFNILPWCPCIIPLIYQQDDWMHSNELSSVQRQLIWYSATELIPMKMLNIDLLLKLLLMYKCGHRNVLSKRQVWMSIFHIINFKKKSWKQGSWYFLIKTHPGLLFLLKVQSCVFISNFHHSPPPPPKGYKMYKLLTWVTLLNHTESVCFKSVIKSGRSLFLSKIKIHR
jgi:hypothetical protein